MSKRGKSKYSIQGQPLYPHIKLTAEKFPRLLSTRIVDETDAAEYFGPFLTRSGARILIDFLNTAFRLRSCTIPIDGTFNVPCTQYYAKRCIAPCVESLCGYDEYLELVDLARSFLHNDRERFEARAYGLIKRSSENLDFERAAFVRDTLENVRSFWSAKRSDVWIDDAVDTYLVERDVGVIKVFIVTTRRARMLGSRVFVFPASDHIDTGEVLAEVIYQFYRVHLPREIRVAFDFERRHEIEHLLADRLGRPVRIVVRGEKPEKVTAMLALARTKLDVELEKIKPIISLAALKRELKSRFGLRKTPARIEAFDAAHISGSFAAAGMSVWKNGELSAEEYREKLSDLSGEIATLREFVSERFASGPVPLPELVLVDGGTSHLNAVLEVLADRHLAIPVVGAVKPQGAHSEISHFVTSGGKRIEFDYSSAAMRLLKVLRDEAHELANLAHRKSRDMAHFYELAAVLPSLNEKERQELLTRFGTIANIVKLDRHEIANVVEATKLPAVINDLEDHRSGRSRPVVPLIVPIRFDDPNGKAGDLRPIPASRISRRTK